MRPYELMLVLSPEADDQRVEGFKTRMRTFITDRGGEVNSEDLWGKRKLAYRIGRFSEGNYFLTRFHLDPAPVKELENFLNVSEDVIRHLLVRQE